MLVTIICFFLRIMFNVICSCTLTTSWEAIGKVNESPDLKKKYIYIYIFIRKLCHKEEYTNISCIQKEQDARHMKTFM